MLRALLVVLTFSVRALCAETEIEFSGILAIDGRTTFAFTDKSAAVTRWIEIGGSVAGFTLTTYDAQEETALLVKDETRLLLRLVSAKVHSSTDVSPENRQAIFANLQKIVAASHRFYLENGRTSARLAELVGPGKLLEELKAIDGESYDALTLFVSAKTFTVTTRAGGAVTYEATEPIPVLRECIIRAGDTLAKIARDSGLTLPQLVAFNPDVIPSQIKIGQKLRLIK